MRRYALYRVPVLVDSCIYLHTYLVTYCALFIVHCQVIYSLCWERPADNTVVCIRACADACIGRVTAGRMAMPTPCFSIWRDAGIEFRYESETSIDICKDFFSLSLPQKGGTEKEWECVGR